MPDNCGMPIQRTSAHRLATLVFMALVTGWLLALVFEKAAAGTASEVLVYALTVGFGLEFLIAGWPHMWPGPGRHSEHGQGV